MLAGPARASLETATRLVVTDSGLGGLSVCALLERALREAGTPDARLTYFNAWPEAGHGYNDMPDTASRARVFDRALAAMASGAPARIVIACNTLSIVYRSTAFSRGPSVPVLGIIDAGVDSFFDALSANPSTGIVLVGTKTTIESGVHRDGLIARGIAADRVTPVACAGLASAIETNPSGSEVARLIDRCAATAGEKRPAGERLYFGVCCTHYTYVSERMRAVLEARCGRPVATLDPGAHLVAEVMRDVPRGGTSRVGTGDRGSGRVAQRGPTVEVVSRVEMNEAKRRAMGEYVRAISPATAAALMAYRRVPELF